MMFVVGGLSMQVITRGSGKGILLALEKSSPLYQIARGEVLDSKVWERIFLLCGVQNLSSHDSDHHFWIAPTAKSIGE
jgi:hypothetical protein